jgi:hypothetical protein
MSARGVAMQNLSQKELDGGDGREHAVAPGGIASCLTRANDRFWLQLSRPLCFESAKHSGDTGYHRSTSCVCGDLRPWHTGDIMVDQHRLHRYKLTSYPLTSCHSPKSHKIVTRFAAQPSSRFAIQIWGMKPTVPGRISGTRMRGTSSPPLWEVIPCVPTRRAPTAGVGSEATSAFWRVGSDRPPESPEA